MSVFAPLERMSVATRLQAWATSARAAEDADGVACAVVPKTAVVSAAGCRTRQPVIVTAQKRPNQA
jgi:hypothetical protein